MFRSHSRSAPRFVPSLVLLCSAVFAASAFGCSNDSAANHGSAEAAPGTHDDWCGEHAVPESLCTRCNPDLIPAFQATGDWCEEHSVPESQCLICNPGLVITRPPAEAP